MQKSTNTILLVLILIALGLCAWFLAKNVNGPKYSLDQQINGINTNPPASVNPTVIGPDAKDLVSFSIKPGDTVSGKMKATGVVSGGYFFEGSMPVSILSANKSLLRAGNAMAIGNWMTAGEVSFSTDLDFSGLSVGPGYIEIKNDNPSGDMANQKQILIPIVIQAKSSSPVSTTISSKYITGTKNWPPSIQTSSVAYSCPTSASENFVAVQKVINGRTYCVSSMINGGAGHWGGEYTYTIASGAGTKTANFELRWGSCGVYGGPSDPVYKQCKSEQDTVFNNLDAMVDSLM